MNLMTNTEHSLTWEKAQITEQVSKSEQGREEGGCGDTEAIGSGLL